MLGVAHHDLAAAREQLDAAHVVGERAVDVVILAVNVAAKRAPDGHELRARHHRRKESARHEGADDLLE